MGRGFHRRAFAAAAALLVLLVGMQAGMGSIIQATETGFNSADADVDLLILADEDFLQALQPLHEHKEYTGISTEIRSWQNIDAAFAGQGRDVQERIKRAIAYYREQYDTKWVMLVGDCDAFPVRYVKAYNTEWGSKYYPSDLYYADLYDSSYNFDDWDGGPAPYGGNNIFGEMDFHGFGEQNINKLNLDRINMYPDIMLGRVPASTVAEVTTYVNKVISYEFAAYQASWFERALWLVDCDFGHPADKDRLDSYLTSEGFTILKPYLNSWWNDSSIPALTRRDMRADAINDAMNDGVGFVNYMGHGNRSAWAWVYDQGHGYDDMAALTNDDTLPVVFAVSCYTGRFHFDLDYYRDVNNNEWTGSTNLRPEPMAVQPSKYDRESFAEEFLVKRNTGGISYVGCTSKNEYGGANLDKYFFEAYRVGWKPATLGYMWNYALTQWIDHPSDDPSEDLTDWYAFIHMHKVMLFGDPSLRVGGVSPFQKEDFLGTYDMNHDGQEGTLDLWAGPDVPGEPNILGLYTGGDGSDHAVHGHVKTWQHQPAPGWRPDYKIEFYVDFPDTPNTEDDFRFVGYLFTQTREAVAGVFWLPYSDVPSGFYAIKQTAASASSADMMQLRSTVIPKEDFLGTYSMNHDGWRGTLELEAAPDDYPKPNITGTYTASDGTAYGVRGHVRTATYPWDSGPDNKIEFWIDFAEPQRFEGYLFWWTRDHIAGITWWHDRPFGFYAISSAAELMEGDANGDGHMSIVDALFIAQYRVGSRTFTADQMTCADTTDDGSVTIVDAMHIAQWLVDPEGSLGVLFKPLWESPADDGMLPPSR